MNNYYKPTHFQAHELVPPEVWKKYGEMSWMFMDERILRMIESLRMFFNVPITVNNYMDGGTFDDRGLRLPGVMGSASMSQHLFGRAIDFDVKGLLADEVRQHIIDHREKYPYITRMENKVNWVHIDCANVDLPDGRIKLFNP